MSSTRIPQFKKLRSDVLYDQYMRLRPRNNGRYREHDEREGRRAALHSGYMVLLALISSCALIFFVMLMSVGFTALTVILGGAILGTALFFSLKYIRNKQARLNQLEGFGNLLLEVPKLRHPLGEMVECIVQQRNESMAVLSSYTLLAQLRCYEITRTDNGTTVSYEHVLLKESELQTLTLRPTNGRLSAKCALQLPQAAHPSLKSPDLTQRQGGMGSSHASIWWLVEIYQPALDTHAYIPIDVVKA